MLVLQRQHVRVECEIGTQRELEARIMLGPARAGGVSHHGSLASSSSTDITDSHPSPRPLSAQNTSIRSAGKKKKKLSRPPTPPRVSSRHANCVPDSPKLSPARTLKRKPKRSTLRLPPPPPKLPDPIIKMASPVKTAPPTALDRGDRFGHDGALSTSGLPMPGLSGRANSPTGK
ncbi:hypothetical protein O1611_g9791 [Lasiodiplodia mahajangana]|uniref:Uncharacterized protein n=1 Tax=Lasiodiplodia mahajangana TaxID=1108764 RepID=A0ACC2J5C2_9PEZI|nr:hypothetical protein O1611_g9791 [Lasiodiplodia mahajangana]